MATIRDLKTGLTYTSGQWAEVAQDRNCDVCLGDKQPAAYDARTKGGRWAWLCKTHFRTMTDGALGIGFGQRLFKEGEFEVMP